MLLLRVRHGRRLETAVRGHAVSPLTEWRRDGILDGEPKKFVPSGKLMARDRLYDLAVASPGLSDEGLRTEMRRVHGLSLSRRSITQYRRELGLETRGLRRGAPAAYAAGGAA